MFSLQYDLFYEAYIQFWLFVSLDWFYFILLCTTENNISRWGAWTSFCKPFNLNTIGLSCILHMLHMVGKLQINTELFHFGSCVRNHCWYYPSTSLFIQMDPIFWLFFYSNLYFDIWFVYTILFAAGCSVLAFLLSVEHVSSTVFWSYWKSPFYFVELYEWMVLKLWCMEYMIFRTQMSLLTITELL